MPKPIRLVVGFNDIYAGSTVAVLPDGFKTLEGNSIGLNPVQDWLWKSWRDCVDKWIPSIVGDDDYVMVGNGDLVEGVHHGGKQVISTDIKDHANAARQLLKPLTEKAKKLFIVKGTECHTNSDEDEIGTALGAETDPDTGRYVFDRLALTVWDCRTIWRHHIGTTTRTYLEASALSINLGVERIEAANNGEPIPQVLCCAHRHRYGEFKDATGLCIVGAPWQMLTRYGHKVVSAARTRPGMFILDWRKRNKGELPEVHSQTYRTPPATGVAI